MSWYKQPIRPYDPVIEDQKDNESSRYYRDSFDTTGQDSVTNPPAQDASLWEQLTNVMPITRAGLNRRWGYHQFASPTTAAKRLASFQRDTDGLRTIVSMGTGVQAVLEDGTLYNNGILNPKLPPRLVNSRSYGYFCSGASQDLKKWDGSKVGGLSNWGIGFPFTLTSLVAGPNPPTSASGWTNSNSALVADGVFATTVTGAGITDTSLLTLGGFGFGIPSNARILGIQVDVKGRVSSADTTTLRQFKVLLLKNNTITGSFNEQPVDVGATNQFYSMGGPADLWSNSWLPNDINGSGFAVGVTGSTNGMGSPGLATWSIDYVQVTVTYQGSPQAPAVTVGGGGAVTLTVGRIYYMIFQNSGTGHLSDLSPASASTGPTTSNVINLSQLAVSSDPQVDTKILLATEDGGDPSLLLYVNTIPNSQTTYADNTDEITLDLNQAYLFTDQFGDDFGVAGNTPPPNGDICVKHKGRLWMAVGQNLYYSKSVADLTLPNGFIAGKYEESWPQDTFLDISEGAETVSGLLSNGQALFIGTQRHIRWVTGDDPTNFSEPEVVHAEVGVLNQEVWQEVFIQGTPSGCMWLTPDFRVIGSDFNTYHDVGHEIQDVLDSINPSLAGISHAMFVDDGEFDLYILAIPTGSNVACDTHCVFNLRSQKWVIWKPADFSQAALFNVTAAGTPQWLFASTPIGQSAGHLYQYVETEFQDRGIAIPVTARSSWLHLGAPTSRKLLDELEVVGDSSMLVTLEGSTPQGDFLPGFTQTLVNQRPFKISPFGQQKIYLASTGAKHRYYRLTFFVPDGGRTFLRSYNLKSIPFNTL